MNSTRENLKAKEQVKNLTLRGDYESALRIARVQLKSHPQDIYWQYQYAKMLGDWADELSPARKKKFKKEAISILRPLLRRLRGRPVGERFGISINYYYQSEDFIGMVQFGKRFTRVDKKQGYYAQALGAGLIAFVHHQKGKHGKARAWARKSAAAWVKYGLKTEKYYFAHYSYAKALALLGEKNRAMKSLITAARLGKRPIADWEFADVLQILEEAKA